MSDAAERRLGTAINQMIDAADNAQADLMTSYPDLYWALIHWQMSHGYRAVAEIVTARPVAAGSSGEGPPMNTRIRRGDDRRWYVQRPTIEVHGPQWIVMLGSWSAVAAFDTWRAALAAAGSSGEGQGSEEPA